MFGFVTSYIKTRACNIQKTWHFQAFFRDEYTLTFQLLRLSHFLRFNTKQALALFLKLKAAIL